MKWLNLIGLLFISAQLFAIEAFVDVKKFNSPSNEPYIEVQILIPANSVEYIEIGEDGKKQAAVETKVIVKQGEQIIDFDKYVLNSQSVAANEKASFNLVDVKRFALKSGLYEIETSFKDLNKDEEAKIINTEVNIEFPESLITISDITLAEKVSPTEKESIYSKSNYDVIPNNLNFYSKEINKLGFYAEIYNTDKVVSDEEYLLSYAVMNEQNTNVSNDLKKFKKTKKSPLQVVLSEFNIEDLPSGNYRLTIEARDKKNELLASKSIKFQRSKPSLNEMQAFEDVDIEQTFVSNMSIDSLSYYLNSILPLLEGNPYTMVEAVSASGDVEKMKNVLFSVWSQLYPHNSAGEFKGYQTVVEAIEKAYGTLQYKGFETDRGRIFLKYGQPAEIVPVYNDPGAYQYEVWTFNRVAETGQTNVRCIFFEPDQGTGNFPLLHSEIRGEIKNDRWKQDLYQSFGVQNNAKDFDNKDVRESFGNRASELMNDFGRPSNTGNNTFDGGDE